MPVPSIDIFVRHNRDCEHRDDERWKRCKCRKHLRWTWEGKQHRKSAKTRSWDAAERARRDLELKYESSALSARPIEDQKPASIQQAITAFLAEKTGGQASANTLVKYRLTLERFQDFCDRHSLYFIREIRLEHLSQWRAEWDKYYGSNFSLRNNQSRLRHFFQYCHNAGMVSANIAKQLSAIKTSDSDYSVHPFTDKEYNAILKAIPRCSDISAHNRQRVKAMIELQRWSGLSLVDAVMLEKSELVKRGKSWRIETSRKKTDAAVKNVIPSWLGRELLRLNDSPTYFFTSGEATNKSATSVYDKLYRKVFKHAGILGGGSHRFRHLFAVSLLEKGVPLKLVSKALGHKSIAITEKYYGRWSDAQQANLERALTRSWQ